VIALKEQILHFVNQREEIQRAHAQARSALAKVQADVQFYQERFEQLENEVRYRIQLISNIEGTAPATAGYSAPPLIRPVVTNPGLVYDLSNYAQNAVPVPASIPSFGVGSIPAPNQPRPSAPEINGVNMGEADRSMV
jgi:hypothetical protein